MKLNSQKNAIIVLMLSLLGLGSCTSNKNVTNENPSQEAEELMEETVGIVGNDTDKHGCKPSAGYQWSTLKNDCIRIFEDGIRLDPKAPDLDQTTSAFVVFKSVDEDDKAEIFIPNKETVILKKTKKEDAGTWTNEDYTLKQWRGMYMLEDAKGKLLYEGMAVK